VRRFLPTLLISLLLCAISQGQIVQFSGAPIPSATPTFVQGVGSDLNDNNGITGNAFQFNLPNATLAGNALVLSIAYPFNASRTVAISDSAGDTWPAAAVTAGTASASNMNSKTFVLPNASAAMHTVTVTFDAAIKPFQYTMAEFYNVATAGAADGNHAANSVAGTAAAAGSYTPTTNNDANGGHLIWTYAISNDTVGTLLANQASAIAKTGGVSPAFMHANNICTIPNASSFDVQATNGAVNPGFNFTQSTGTNFVVASVALKAASAGTAPGTGIRVKRILHYSVVNPQIGNNTITFPVDGNLRVATMAAGSNLHLVNSVKDTDNATGYADRTNASGESRVFDSFNTGADNANAITLNLGSPDPQFSLHLWDVVGATTGFMNASGFNGNAPASGSVFNDFPDHTPNANVSGLTIAQTGMGTAGPQFGFAAGAPAGAVFDVVFYTGMTDQDRMDNADPFGHVNFSSNAAQAWNWKWNSGCSNCANSTAFATAASYK
jgi:hypothetical protein